MSTYSPLKIELINTGTQAGSWGNTTNVNLGTALEEAITGSADVAFSSADVTLTLANNNASQTGRNLRLNLTGTSGGARELILGTDMQIKKLYLINNGLADAVTVKNTTGTGIAVPAGKSMFVFNNGTNVVDAVTHLTSLTLGAALPVASGGTGITSLGTGVATWLGTPSSANLAAAVTDETGSGALVFATSPTLVTPTLGAASATSVAFGAGAVGTPSITTTGDTNTGIYFPGADRVGIVTGGIQRVEVNASGNVGIGTSLPAVLLDVRASQTTQIRIGSTGTDLSNDTEIGTLEFFNSDSNQNAVAAYVRAIRGSAFGSGGLLTFATSTTGSTAGAVTERMRIDSSGNVGIGTSSPNAQARLHVSSTNSMIIPTGTTAERPSSPVTGMMRFNTTTGFTEVYDGTAWTFTNSIIATGGTITNIDVSGAIYRVHTFTSSGTFEVISGSTSVEYLVIAGGGGGGYGGGAAGGGGGAGGYRTASGFVVNAATAYTVTVGSGGAGAASDSVRGSNGNDSVFSTITSTGGGGGGSNDLATRTGAGGGSGGGGCTAAGSGGAGTSGQGNNGGAAAVATNDGGGGGGGASAVGGNGGDGFGGNGGSGTASSISGSSVTYAGGGGGAMGFNSGTRGVGGAGGGGNGQKRDGAAGSNATVNTGGGGGGSSTTGSGYNGGSGIVIIRYRIG